MLVGVLLPFQSTIFSWMQIPTELLSNTSIYLTIVVLGLPIQSTYQTYSMMYRTQGMMKQSMFITAFVNILNIVGNYCLIFGIGLIGIWIGMTMDEGVRAVLFIYRWFQGKWKTKTLVHA